MRKTTLSTILAATGIALAGAAHAADTFDSPTRAGEASTMTMGEPNAETTNSPYSDNSMMLMAPSTTVLGAGPATVTSVETTTFVTPTYSTISGPVVTYYGWSPIHGGASETSNVPLRAGEASTMTNGVPNAHTLN
jgi:hypothetical protein